MEEDIAPINFDFDDEFKTPASALVDTNGEMEFGGPGQISNYLLWRLTCDFNEYGKKWNCIPKILAQTGYWQKSRLKQLNDMLTEYVQVMNNYTDQDKEKLLSKPMFRMLKLDRQKKKLYDLLFNDNKMI